jgi:AcrR family transcriptional regulator
VATRQRRADAERNRLRVIEAADEMFAEHGLEIGVAEIAQRAGVGRATLFRNFPTKDDLIAAIVVERMRASVARGREALRAPDPAVALFALIEDSTMRSRTDRALFDALSDSWMANAEIRGAHAELLDVLDALVRRAQDAGAVRTDIGAVDLLMMIKGVCESLRSFAHVSPDLALRQLDLVRAAISVAPDGRPLRGSAPTIADLD